MTLLTTRFAVSMLAGLGLLCGVAHADEARFCDYRVQHEIQLQDDGRVTLADGRHRLVIDGDRLYVDGREQHLDDTQRADLARFRENLAALVPEVAELAISAASLGLSAANQALAILTGDAEDGLDALEERFEEIERALRERYDGRSWPQGALEDAGLARLDTLGELIADQALSLASSSVELVFTALTDPSALEARAERVEALVEARVERQAALLERTADTLCTHVAELDALEARIGAFDVFDTPGTRHRRI